MNKNILYFVILISVCSCKNDHKDVFYMFFEDIKDVNYMWGNINMDLIWEDNIGVKASYPTVLNEWKYSILATYYNSDALKISDLMLNNQYKSYQLSDFSSDNFSNEGTFIRTPNNDAIPNNDLLKLFSDEDETEYNVLILESKVGQFIKDDVKSHLDKSISIKSNGYTKGIFYKKGTNECIFFLFVY